MLGEEQTYALKNQKLSLDELSDELNDLLKSNNISKSLYDIFSIIDGVNASALPQTDTSWMSMVLHPMPSELGKKLSAMRKNRFLSSIKNTTASSEERLVSLRNIMEKQNLQGYLIPRADEYQSEYLPKSSQRLAWLTGFDGSAGFAIVLKQRAAIFTDGRYTLQIRDQVDEKHFEIYNTAEMLPLDWLESNLSKNDCIGFDPWLHTCDEVIKISTVLASKDAEAIKLSKNLIDEIWLDRPPVPLGPITPHPEIYAGEAVASKFDTINTEMMKNEEDVVIISSPESIAWLLNIRGSDVARTPLPLSFLMLNKEGHAKLFVDQRKIVDETRNHLGNAVSILPIKEFGSELNSLARGSKKIRLDPKTCPAWVAEKFNSSSISIVHGDDPTLIPKAKKNKVELAGTRAAHIRDGAAFVRFLHWFSLNAKHGQLDEIIAATKLQNFREKDPLFKDLSFDTISGSGPNGAIVHYRVTEESNRTIELGDLYLVDSGAQYLDGTTDITRTIAVGDPGDEAKNYFTRVLKGHIAIASSKFPVGTNGSQLDALARAPLWAIGADYDHGTGHGVGSYLGVHEGPQRISKLPNSVSLQPGMIVSNEPGYYKSGAYGIRLENLLVVQSEIIPNSERAMLSFETITLAPFDRSMILNELLEDHEKSWLNNYHAWVRKQLLPLLSPNDGAWLIDATEPL